MRAWWLRKYYDLSLEQFEEMRLAQGGGCAVCHDPERKLVVDHDHVTGRIRGLLCQPHNAALGVFGDSIEGLQAAIEYLKRSSNVNRASR